MPLITTTSGKEFSASAGESLLDAALRAKVSFGYSCRTGRCSACKSRVISGATEPLHEELGLTSDELARGWILGCVRTATSNALLEVDDLSEFPLTSARTLPCRIQALNKLSVDVMQVHLRLPPASTFQYRAGQYLEVIGHGGLRRSYSIANASGTGAGAQIELHIRRVVGGAMSEYWFSHAKANDLLRIHGPLGTFFLRDADDRDLVFLATGTGIAPVKAILEEMLSLQTKPKLKSVSVYWGGRSERDLYWDPRSTGLPLRYTPVLSRGDDNWRGTRGYVHQAYLAHGPQLANALVYACGSNAMICSARSQLTAAGLPDRRFRSDAFVSSAVA
jgi:CDP-4-dehydro-6-deoxyglucose reductase, E3